jgi:hypothetical protein
MDNHTAQLASHPKAATTQPSIHLRFQATAIELYQNSAFLTPALKLVYVTCTDQSTHTQASIPENGTFVVDFHLYGSYLVDTLKFHFFDGEGHFIASSYVDLPELMANLKANKPTDKIVRNSREPNISVHLSIMPFAGEPLPNYTKPLSEMGFKPSVLKDTARANDLFRRMNTNVFTLLNGQCIMKVQTGARMFMQTMTTHAMEDQYTLTVFMERDMDPPNELLDLYLNSGILMYSLIDSMHFRGVIIDNFKDFPDEYIARFVIALSQTIQRSNHECRYMPDTTPIPDDPSSSSREHTNSRPNKLKSTEYFKRTMCEPFLGDALYVDDCEGLGETIINVVKAFGYLYRVVCKGKCEPDSELRTAMKSRLFPPHLINATEGEKSDLLEIALKIGKMVESNEIRCRIVIMSCHAAYVGAAGNGEIGGHVTVSLQYRPADDPANTRNEWFDVILEGTNCTESDAFDENVKISVTSGVIDCHLSDVAQLVEELMLTEVDNDQITTGPFTPRFGLHFSDINRLKVYNTVFTQGDRLLATRTQQCDIDSTEASRSEQEVKQLEYGLSAAEISNYAIRQELEIQGLCINEGERAWLNNFCVQRALEIHTPFVTLPVLDEYLTKHWQRIEPPTTAAFRPGTHTTDCFVSWALDADPAKYNPIVQAAVARSNDMNRLVKKEMEESHETSGNHVPWCHSRSWASMGSLMTCMTISLDDRCHLEGLVKRAMTYALATHPPPPPAMMVPPHPPSSSTPPPC